MSKGSAGLGNTVLQQSGVHTHVQGRGHRRQAGMGQDTAGTWAAHVWDAVACGSAWNPI